LASSLWPFESRADFEILDFLGRELREHVLTVARRNPRYDILRHGLGLAIPDRIGQRSGPPYYGRDSASSQRDGLFDQGSRGQARGGGCRILGCAGDRKHVLAQLSSKEIKYFEVGTASKGQSEDAKTVSLAGLVTTRIPAAEWRERFLLKCGAAIAIISTSKNMHGYDWQKLRAKYQPLLDFVGVPGGTSTTSSPK